MNNLNFLSVFWILIGHTIARADNICHIIINNQSEAKKRIKKLMIVQFRAQHQSILYSRTAQF